MQTIVFYISGHGYGHASRQIAVIQALRARRADLRVVVRTSAPRWLFDRSLAAPVDVVPGAVDTGVVQVDSLTVDVAASIDQAWAFHERLPERSEREARWLETQAASLVVADIPPLAFAAAQRAGLPAVGVSNFTWDWIYEAYRPEIASAPELVPAIRRAYAAAAVAWRLPMHGGFESFQRVVDVPLVGRQSTLDQRDARRRLRLPADQPLAFVEFGRYGLAAIDWAAVATITGCGIVLTAEEGRVALDARAVERPFLVVSERALGDRVRTFQDLLRAVDVLVTKPGYGMIAECAANDTAMLYTARGRFVEYDVLVAAMPRFIRSAYIPQDELFRGHWRPHLSALLEQARPSAADVSGAEVVADGILDLV